MYLIVFDSMTDEEIAAYLKERAEKDGPTQ